MTDKKRDLTELEPRAQQVAQLLVEAANDPAGDARRAAAEAERDHDQQLILDAYHASRRPTVPPSGTPLASLDALREHLRATGSTVTAHAAGLCVAGDPPIDVSWAAEHRQVRFTIAHEIRVTPSCKAAVAAVVAKGNALSGTPVWRAEPELIAEVTAPTADDGSVSSAEVDRAVKILRTTFARDAAELHKAAGG